MDALTVQKVAKIAGVSVRTLHHYDNIGLLKPKKRADSGYRYYGKEELLKLQQILFYKELGLSLQLIQQMLDEPGFDIIKALQYHKKQLKQQVKRYQTLLQTIDHTIDNLKNNTEMSNYDELYKGFPAAQASAWEQEVTEKYGKETLEESKQKINAMSKGELQAVQEESEALYAKLAKAMNLPPSHTEVQALIHQHFNLMQIFFTCPTDTYRGIGNLYVDDNRYTAFFEKYREGMAIFMRDAILVYCEKQQA